MDGIDASGLKLAHDLVKIWALFRGVEGNSRRDAGIRIISTCHHILQSKCLWVASHVVGPLRPLKLVLL